MTWKNNKGLVLTILFLIGLGLVQVYSSSFIFAIESRGDGLYFFLRQLIFSFVAVFALYVGQKVPFQYLKVFGLFLWIIGMLGLALTFVPQFSIQAGGAARWIRLPFGQRFEPAELLKITTPFVVATFLAYPMRGLKNWKWPIFALIIAPMFVLFLKQPDFGSAVICGLIVLTMLFCFGLQWRYVVAGVLTVIPIFYFFIYQVPYRWARIQAFVDPWSDPSNKGFQIIQSLLSYYAGGATGVGLGQGQGKLFFLPEAHTDFAFSVLGEEMGFVGFAFVLLLFGFVIFRGFQIALNSQNAFTKALALGLVTAFALGFFINVGVTLGLLPTKGLSMPFLSYGGSSLVSTCFGLGLLLNIDKFNYFYKSKKDFRGYHL